MISVSVYHIKYDGCGQIQYVWADEEIVCPFCACTSLIKKGWRKRKLITLNDEVIALMVRRVKCKDCDRIHHVLPDIVVPYKRHDLETIEKIVQGNKNETVCEESVINRIKVWWQKILIYITMLKESLKSQITKLSESKLSMTVRILTNAHLWPGTRIALNMG